MLYNAPPTLVHFTCNLPSVVFYPSISLGDFLIDSVVTSVATIIGTVELGELKDEGSCGA